MNINSPKAIEFCQSFLDALDRESDKSLWRLCQLAGVDDQNVYRCRAGKMTISIGSMMRLARAARLHPRILLEKTNAE